MFPSETHTCRCSCECLSLLKTCTALPVVLICQHNMPAVPTLPDLDNVVEVRNYLKEVRDTMWTPPSEPCRRKMYCMECERWVSVACMMCMIDTANKIWTAPVTCSFCSHGRFRWLAFGRMLLPDEEPNKVTKDYCATNVASTMVTLPDDLEMDCDVWDDLRC